MQNTEQPQSTERDIKKVGLRQLYIRDPVAVEMARRKVVFHKYEEWDKINLWGLFRYTYIKKYLENGRLLNNLNYEPKNTTYWVTPSKEYWEEVIRPITEQFTEEELQESFMW